MTWNSAPSWSRMMSRPGVADRYPDGLIPQGISAELIAAKWNLSRAELDEFSAASHQRAAAAQAGGLFAGELTPVAVTSQDGTTRVVEADEGIRPATTAEVLAGLRPAFYDPAVARRFPQIGWHVTAGNSKAFESPCGTWKKAPIGRLMPCTRQTLAFENAMPAWVAPSIIASRAVGLPGSRQAVRICLAISPIAALATPSVKGLALRLT